MLNTVLHHNANKRNDNNCIEIEHEYQLKKIC